MEQDILGNEQPQNELEEHLFAMWAGRTTKEDFLRVFLISDVFIIVDGEPVGNTLGDRKPMVLSVSIDQPKLMAVFSSPERATRLTEQFPDYNYPIKVDTRWVLHTIGASMGVAFNPGWTIGFEIAPEGAQQLKMALDNAIAQAGEI
jgi:hypothetical protein